MDLFQESTDWAKDLAPLIKKYKDQKHPLDYQNIYQLLVMVVLSAQDSDKHINELAPELFKKFPTLKSLTKADKSTLEPLIGKVRFFDNKAGWLLEIAATVQEDKNIPLTMSGLTALKGIGRKSANVIIREAGVPPEGIMVDLHVVRVAPRLGIAKSKEANKIEKELMQALPKRMWQEIGMAMSFLGRDICRPTHPKHELCPVKEHCAFCQGKRQ